MSQKLKEVPEEYRFLLPDTDKRTIVIGTEAHEILPLTEGEFEQLWVEIGEMFARAASAIAEALMSRDGKRKSVEEQVDVDPIAVGITTIKETLQEMLSSGRVAKIIGIATQQDAEDIRKKMTLRQGVHIISVLYEQNFSMKGLPEDIRKNLEGFLEMFGINIRKGRNPSQEMLDITLETLAEVEDHKTSRQEALDKMKKAALKRGFKLPSNATESMKPSPEATAGPENTSKEPSSTNVGSQENAVGAATGQDSVKELDVALTAASPTPQKGSMD